ncbi:MULTISPECIES: rhodanese-like domain-containing protein [Helcococcus]|uniref:Rhodanese-like domain-containing protein n=1 Tax=Helcococcus bovis TaxID=3153252 RepID=A0ABW9F8J2_9FIRM
MKKIISSILALVLVFSLVACGSTTKKETMKETAKETIQEETKAENPAEKKYISVAIDDKHAIATNDNKTFEIYELSSKYHPTLSMGNKYEFKIDPAKIQGDKLTFDKDLEMLGIKVGFPLSAQGYQKLMEKVKNVKVVDTRDAKSFGEKTVEGAVNINGAEALKAVKSRKIKDFKNDSLKDFTSKDIVVVFGNSPEENAAVAEILFNVSHVMVTFNGGDIKEVLK